MRKNFWLLILSIVVLIVVSGILIWRYWPQSQHQPETNEQEPVPATSSPATSSPEAGIKQWHVYQDKQYGYELQYPSNWEAIKCLETVIFAPKETIQVIKDAKCLVHQGKTLTLTANFRTKEQFEKIILPYRKTDEGKKVSRETVTIDGVEAIRYRTEYLKNASAGFQKGDIIIDVLPPIKNGYLEISLLDNQYLDTYNQMLSTFKFTDSAVE